MDTPAQSDWFRSLYLNEEKSYVSELSHKDIAKLLKIPEGTVASRKNHALNLLKQAKEELL
jgi:DNA-directed RNA polymerase specialized sigma24 family protein